MALTVADRGTGTHNTGATTLVPGGRTATLSVGSMGVFCIALDNAGSAGASLIAPDSWTDAKSNVWTLRTNALYDNGAASAGIEMAFYTAPITTDLLTTDLGTMTWKAGASPVAKAWSWYAATPSGGNTVSYSTGGNIAGATAANAQVTTASVTVGDAVFCGYFSENVNAVTGDSDTTNGSWATQQTATVGTGTGGVRIATQSKVQTTTASTQSYDVTVSSQDRIAGYILLHEVINTTVTPGVASLTTSTFAPTITASDNRLVTPTTASLTTSTFAPAVTATANQLVTPSTAALTTTEFAPTVATSDNKLVVPPTASLTLTTFAPTVTVSAGNIVVVPGTRALAITALAASVFVGIVATPAMAALTTTLFAPTVTATAHVTVVPGTRALTLSTFVPVITAGITATPNTAVLALSTFVPTVTTTTNVTAVPVTASLVLTRLAPTVATGIEDYGTNLQTCPLPHPPGVVAHHEPYIKASPGDRADPTRIRRILHIRGPDGVWHTTVVAE